MTMAYCASEDNKEDNTKSNSDYNSLNDEDDTEFVFLNHPAIVYSHKRLQDPEIGAQFHTVHVFDFDQTLFRSPVLNTGIWDPYFLSKLISWDECGSGWWLTRDSLELGLEAEQSGWAGWWNEDLVQVVRESARNPACLTILLTGRYGPLYGDLLCRMTQSKQLDFDLIATKPASAALIPDKPIETYMKLHTFSTKREFLYNLLLEYPGIRKMTIWDDRPGQVAQFRQAGEKWIEEGMLEDFEVIKVTISERVLEPEQEIEVVKRMIGVHNQQVEREEAAIAAIDAEGGEGKVQYLVSGAGKMPRLRPELKHVKDMWDPYWEYVPQRRTKIELKELVQYTRVEFSANTQDFLRRIALNGTQEIIRGQGSKEQDNWKIQLPAALQDIDISTWTPALEFYIFLCARKAHPEYRRKLGGIGATVFVLIDGVGQVGGKAWALRVRGMHSRALAGYKVLAPDGQVFSSVKSYLAAHPVRRFGNVVMRKQEWRPYITMAFDRSQGGRASDTSKITHWEPLHPAPQHSPAVNSLSQTTSRPAKEQKFVLVGTISEKVLMGINMPNLGQQAKVPRAEVHIPQLVQKYIADKKLDISGHEIGATLKAIEAEMNQEGIANLQSNHDQIFEIVLRICGELRSSSHVDESL
ncbi:hypothetical protein FBU30_000569 [Linnemannia zychae]|nr:hypothetical protein FBU30_000569 [Linnemannia zychae]